MNPLGLQTLWCVMDDIFFAVLLYEAAGVTPQCAEFVGAVLSEVYIAEDEEFEVFCPIEGVDGWDGGVGRCGGDIRGEDGFREESAGEGAVEECDDVLWWGGAIEVGREGWQCGQSARLALEVESILDGYGGEAKVMYLQCVGGVQDVQVVDIEGDGGDETGRFRFFLFDVMVARDEDDEGDLQQFSEKVFIKVESVAGGDALGIEDITGDDDDRVVWGDVWFVDEDLIDGLNEVVENMFVFVISGGVYVTLVDMDVRDVEDVMNHNDELNKKV